MSTGWPRVRLGEVLHHRKEFVLIDDLTTYTRPRVQLHARGIVLRDEIPGALIKTKKQQVCRAGELLVAEIDAKVGGVGLVPESLDGAIVSSHYFLFTIDHSKLDRRFLGFFIQTRGFLDQIEAQGSTNYAAIRPADVLSYEMPLPPLPEQRRIAARIEELAARIDEARGLRREAAAGVSAIVGSVSARVFAELAAEYGYRPLGALASHIVDGPHKTPQYLTEGARGVPFVTVKNMVTGSLDLSDLHQISEADHRLLSARCRAERGDVLYSKDGATRGEPCLVDTDREFSFFVSVALIKPLRDRLDSRYLVHLLRSNWIRDRVLDRSRGDMIPHIVLREIRSLPVPVPPLTEQRRVAARTEALCRRAEGARQLQQDALHYLDALFVGCLELVSCGQLLRSSGTGSQGLDGSNSGKTWPRRRRYSS
jgi:type I restriction enzyme S subunit